MIILMKRPFMLTTLHVFLHTAGWLIFFLVPFIDFPLSFDFDRFRVLFHMQFTLFMIVVFYTNYFFLIPMLLTRRKVIGYILLSSLACIVLSFTLDIVLRNTLPPSEPVFQTAGPPPDVRLDRPPLHEINEGPQPNRKEKPKPLKGVEFFITFTLISIGIKMTSEWLQSDKIKRELENDKLKAELAALKAQINPHFFFNVMNSLVSLARKKSDQTETYIIKLSEILRYNLNNLSSEKVSVEKELQFIRNYSDIQYLRISGMEPVEITVTGNPETVFLEPMLLFPFVENAFKHGNVTGKPLRVSIELHVNPGSFLFRVENTVSESAKSHEESSGIGLANIRRRLDLLYPGRYSLDIGQGHNRFEIILEIITT